VPCAVRVGATFPGGKESFVRTLLLAIFVPAVALLTGGMIAHHKPATMLLVIFAVLIVLVTFLNIECGLVILILSMLLSPEFIAGSTAGSSMNRGVTLRMEDMLLMLIGLSWFARTAVRKELGLFLKTPLNKPIGLYMVVCLLSTGYGIMSGRVELKTGALFVLKYFEYFIVYFMIVNHVRSREQVKRFVFFLFLTAMVVALIGIFQIPGGGRVSAPFEGRAGEPNTLGGYLLFIGMMAAGLASKEQKPLARHLLWVLIVCLLPPFFFTQSRTSYVAAIPACLALSFMTERRMIIVGLVAVGLLLSPLFLPSIVKQRMLYTFNQPQGPGQITIGAIRLDTSTSARLESWQNALEDFWEHPILGYGVSGYKFLDAQVPRVLAETGLVGLAAFLYLLAALFKLALERMRAAVHPFDKGLSVGFLAGYIGLLVHSLGVNTFIIVRIMEPFWFFAGIIAVLSLIDEETRPAAVYPEQTVRTHLRNTLPAFPRGGDLSLTCRATSDKKSHAD
jgi:O-antigen ligase